VRIAAGIILKCVEDGEGGWAKSNTEPGGRCGLLCNQALPVAQKFGDFVSLPGFASSLTSKPFVVMS
jgi:hypothetical protein